MERERILNIPNAITTIRIGLIGMYMAIHFIYPEQRKLSMACFALAGCTDFLDGMTARKLGQVTRFGKLLDPLADKMMTLSALVCLVTSKVIPIWLIVLAAIKEFYMVSGACLLLRRQTVIAADLPGKISTFLFVPAVILVYPWHGVSLLNTTGMYMLSISLSISAWAAVFYTYVAVKKSRSGKTD